ncbi:MAG: response regulator [Armatimonadetes bacterium]|nr:response regulator [Armatimonadota bacterium]
MMIRVLVAVRAPTEREQLRRTLFEQGIEVVGLAQDGQEALQMSLQLKPDVCLIDADLSVLNGFQATELIVLGSPETLVILISDRDDPAHLRDAMRAGARDCLARPVQPVLLLETIKKVYEVEEKRRSPEFVSAIDPSRLPRTVSVTGAKGGIGKTTIAVNLAISLLQETRDRTVLVDFYTQFGDVGMMLNINPKRTITDLIPMLDELDADLLEDHMMVHETGLKVLLGAATPQPLDILTVHGIESILNILKRTYRIIVIDVPPILHAGTLYVLSHSHLVVLVANLFDLTTINDTKMFYEALGGSYISREKIKVILNRVSKQNRLQTTDVEKALGQPVSAHIPNDGRLVPTSINQGLPVTLSHPTAPVSQSLRSLARSFLEDGKPALSEQPKRKGLFNW